MVNAEAAIASRYAALTPHLNGVRLRYRDMAGVQTPRPWADHGPFEGRLRCGEGWRRAV